MLESIASFFSSLKQTSPVVYLGVSIGTGIILFGGDSFIASLGLETFRTETKGFLGAAFVISTSILLSQVVFGIFKVAKKKYQKNRKAKKRLEVLKKNQEKLHNLTPDEKAYLIPYVLSDENTQYFLLEDGVVGGLQAKGLIYRSANVGSMVDGWAFNIQPWVRDYLRENPNYLEGANPNPQGPPRW